MKAHIGYPSCLNSTIPHIIAEPLLHGVARNSSDHCEAYWVAGKNQRVFEVLFLSKVVLLAGHL